MACVIGAETWAGQRANQSLLASGAEVVAVTHVEVNVGVLASLQTDNLKVFQTVSFNKDTLDTFIAQVAQPFGTPDIVVHSADKTFEESAENVTKQAWSQTVKASLSDPCFINQSLVESMKAKKLGRVVHIASTDGLCSVPNTVSYGAAIAGVTQLVRSMADAWSRFGVTVDAIAPNCFSEQIDGVNAETCIGRTGKAKELDGPILFLCSNASNYVTGQTLNVGGGHTAK
ncbi:MAG: SDR family NAD(P)-dependent oxidoreductase [Paracoccaceae bacterium]